MSGRLLRPDDPQLIIVTDWNPGAVAGAKVTMAVDADGEMLCSCSSWRYPCEHMIDWIKEGGDVPGPDQPGQQLGYSFDLNLTSIYEIPLFKHFMTSIRLDDGWIGGQHMAKVQLAPPVRPVHPLQDRDHAPVVGFIDDRFEGRLAIRNLIIDWLKPWTSEARRNWSQLQCQKVPAHSTRWTHSMQNQIIQVHNLLMFGLCNDCVSDLDAEVPDV